MVKWYLTSALKKKKIKALVRWLNWLECCYMHQKVAGSIPGQGIYPGCGCSTPGHRTYGRQSIDVSLSLSSLSLPSPSSLSKINKDTLRWALKNSNSKNLKSEREVVHLLYWQEVCDRISLHSQRFFGQRMCFWWATCAPYWESTSMRSSEVWSKQPPRQTSEETIVITSYIWT